MRLQTLYASKPRPAQSLDLCRIFSAPQVRMFKYASREPIATNVATFIHCPFHALAIL